VTGPEDLAILIDNDEITFLLPRALVLVWRKLLIISEYFLAARIEIDSSTSMHDAQYYAIPFEAKQKNKYHYNTNNRPRGKERSSQTL
jgi:hypothetical protein